MVALMDTWKVVLMALVGGRSAFRTPAEVARALGRDVEETTDVLAELDEAGWVEIWERPEGPAVTLSALGAARLGYHLVEEGRSAQLRWAPVGDPEPPAPRARSVVQGDRAADLEFVIDPRIGPDVAAELAERAEAEAAREGDGRAAPPRPTLLIGEGLTPWPGPDFEAESGAETCPACGCRRLSPNMYCLRCDRWGLDSKESPPRVRAPRPSRRWRPSRPTPNEPRLMAERAKAERRRRKSKRAARLAARFRTGRP